MQHGQASKAKLTSAATQQTKTEPTPSSSAIAQSESLSPVATAAHGVRSGGQPLPHADRIQASFGQHNVADVQAHIGGAAAQSAELLGAQAYATGRHVAFAAAPDVHTAAHEAAHVVQQRAGVALKGGVDGGDDRHERHADAVADRVVRGESAEGLLDEYRGAGGQPVVQRKRKRGVDRLRASLAKASVHLDAAMTREIPMGDGGLDEQGPGDVEQAEPAYRALPDPKGIEAIAMPPLPKPPPAEGRAQIHPQPEPRPKPKSVAHVAAEDLAQASMELDDAQAEIQAACADDGQKVDALTSHAAAFIQLVCAQDAARADAPPKKFAKAVSTPELQQVEAARAAIKMSVLSTHERTFTNPDFMRVLPHSRKKNAPRNRIFRPSLKILRQQATGTNKLAQQQGKFAKLEVKIAGVQADIDTREAAVAALTAKSGDSKAGQKKIAQQRSRVEHRHKALKVLHTKLKAQAAVIEAQQAHLDALSIALQNAAEQARPVLIAELAKRIAKLEKSYAKRAALTEEFEVAEAEAEDADAAPKSKGRRSRIRTARGKVSRLKRQLVAAAKALAKLEKRADLSELRLLAERAEDESLLVSVEQTEHQGEIDGQTYDLRAPKPGHVAMDRPAGFSVGGRQRIPEEVTADAVLGQLEIPKGDRTPRDERRFDAGMGTMTALGAMEGRADSVNTWDNVTLTLGPGLAGRGVLQKAFWYLRRESPATFQALFGRYGVDVHEAGTGFVLSVVDPESKTRVKGKPAREMIANSPKLLVACRHAGKHRDWQQALAVAKAGYSITAGVDFKFEVRQPNPDGTTQTWRLSLVDVLKEATEEDRGMALAAIADRKHAGGDKGLTVFRQRVPKLFLDLWLADKENDKEDDEGDIPSPELTQEEQMSLSAQILALIPTNRAKKIREAFSR